MEITLIYFVYGLAFFTMGLSLMFEARRSATLTEAGVPQALSAFGLIHGAHEWIEMFVDKTGWVVIRDPVTTAWLRLTVLAVSFIMLLIFGLRMLQPMRRLNSSDKLRWTVGGVFYLLMILSGVSLFAGGHLVSVAHLDAAIRYLLAVPAATISGIALLRRASFYYQEHGAQLVFWMRSAALGFLGYGITQLVTPPLAIFPANLVNTVAFQSLTGIPIQAVRACLAVWITISILQMIKILENRRQTQLLAAQHARIEALDRLQLELQNRESLRREFMHRIVLAQEDERGRIARELHDETSQTLTAANFHLAALRQSLANNGRECGQIETLQTLNRQMSQGVYRLIHDLRPAQLDGLGLVAALQHLVNDVQMRTGLVASFRISGEKRRLDQIVETVLFRIAQEALTNVARHSGVKQASVKLTFAPETVALYIEDGGNGFDPHLLPVSGAGLGLLGMRERVESIGGHLNIDSAPGCGVRVAVLIGSNPEPLRAAADREEKDLVTWK